MFSSMTRLFYKPTLPPTTPIASSRDFHFCRILPGDQFPLSLERHLHYLCGALGLKPGQEVLNVGSGTGDTAVELVRFAEVTVVGLVSNIYKIQFATRRIEEAGLLNKISFVHSNVLSYSVLNQSFDAILAMETIKDAPSFFSACSELAPLLARDGKLGIVDWCWTTSFDIQDPDHVRLAALLESALFSVPRAPEDRTLQSGSSALSALGLHVLHTEDLAARHGTIPWYMPLETALGNARAPWTSERLGISREELPADELDTSLDEIFPLFGGISRQAAVLLVEAGKLNLFTPLALFVAKKPM
ncbi:S-adenosyl-L-methionine-dependent methyltransferase [Cubamyces lactineus]|nr:S-adenosyl-L-methionine-dependent methyltransferase [Cubamyces lactineus]